MENLLKINNVRGFIDENGVVQLNLEDVARGLGFVDNSKEVEYVRWNTVTTYLKGFGFSQEVAKDSFIPENIFYRLAMKAKNETAEKFQSIVADEILPAIRKTGSYSFKPLSQLEILAQSTQILLEQEKAIQQLAATQEKQGEQLAKLIEIQDRKADIVSDLPQVNQLDQRSQLNQIIRGYAERNNLPHSTVWHKLYEEFLYRYSINIKVRASNRKQKALDYCQYNGYLPDLLALSINLFC